MGKSEGFVKEFTFLKLWSLYGYIVFDHRDNHKNYGIFFQTKQVVEIPLLGLELRFYRLRFITLQTIFVSGRQARKKGHPHARIGRKLMRTVPVRLYSFGPICESRIPQDKSAAYHGVYMGRCLFAFRYDLMCCNRNNAEPPRTSAVDLHTGTWQEHPLAWH